MSVHQDDEFQVPGYAGMVMVIVMVRTRVCSWPSERLIITSGNVTTLKTSEEGIQETF